MLDGNSNELIFIGLTECQVVNYAIAWLLSSGDGRMLGCDGRMLEYDGVTVRCDVRMLEYDGVTVRCDVGML